MVKPGQTPSQLQAGETAILGGADLHLFLERTVTTKTHRGTETPKAPGVTGGEAKRAPGPDEEGEGSVGVSSPRGREELINLEN